MKYSNNKNKTHIGALICGLSMLSLTSYKLHASDYIVPAMVNIPAGEFDMGSDKGDLEARPKHTIAMSEFRMAKYPVTVAEYRKFVEDTGFKPNTECNDIVTENWFSGPDVNEGKATWDKHQFLYSDYLPVTCMTWNEANAYADWLSEKTGTPYRLPTEQEWEYSLRANTTSQFFWGDDPNMTQACLYGNFADKSGEYHAIKDYGASYVGFLEYAKCDDGEPYGSIVGLYRPNPFGLYDMVGNISQYTSTCYYKGYQARSEQEMDNQQCEYISHRGETWHFPPQPHAARARAKRLDETGWALTGFRLAVDGHSDEVHNTTREFESKLAKAQKARLDHRPTLPEAPQNLQLVKRKNNSYTLSWQPNTTSNVTGYDVYRSLSRRSYLLGGAPLKHYEKIKTVSANKTSLKVKLPESEGSFRVVTKTSSLTSLSSEPVSILSKQFVEIPGRINMETLSSLENASLAHRPASKDKEELFYLSKFNKGYEQPMVTSTFNLNVKKSGWYILNYRGGTGEPGTFFRIWSGNRLVAEVDHDENIDDKQSDRHRVYLEKGPQQVQLSVKRYSLDFWNLVWLDLKEVG